MYKRLVRDRLSISRSSAAEQNLSKMKSVILVALALVAVAIAVPVNEPVKILRSEFDQQPEGGYVSSFETENGIKSQETGELKQVLNEENKPQNVVVVRGSYEYTNPEGVLEAISYYADETGFHAEGPSVPKPARR